MLLAGESMSSRGVTVVGFSYLRLRAIRLHVGRASRHRCAGQKKKWARRDSIGMDALVSGERPKRRLTAGVVCRFNLRLSPSWFTLMADLNPLAPSAHGHRRVLSH